MYVVVIDGRVRKPCSVSGGSGGGERGRREKRVEEDGGWRILFKGEEGREGGYGLSRRGGDRRADGQEVSERRSFIRCQCHPICRHISEF